MIRVIVSAQVEKYLAPVAVLFLLFALEVHHLMLLNQDVSVMIEAWI